MRMDAAAAAAAAGGGRPVSPSDDATGDHLNRAGNEIVELNNDQSISQSINQ